MAIDARRLRTEYIYEGRGPLGSLLADAGEIDGIIEVGRARRRKLRWWSLYCLIAFVVGLIVGLVAHSVGVLLLGWTAFAACFALFIYSSVYARKLLGHRSHNDLLKQLLGIIQNDAHSKAPFAVRLSMASTPQLLTEGEWTARKKGKQQFFQERWLTIEGPLLDGTTLSADITELSRKRTYTNPRGKRKTKTRSRYLVTLRFAYPPELYGDARRSQLALSEQVRVPPSAKLRGVRVSEKAITMKGLVLLERDIAVTAGMLSMATYRILNHARRVAPGQKGSAK
jgi:hypothetical protein